MSKELTEENKDNDNPKNCLDKSKNNPVFSIRQDDAYDSDDTSKEDLGNNQQIFSDFLKGSHLESNSFKP